MSALRDGLRWTSSASRAAGSASVPPAGQAAGQQMTPVPADVDVELVERLALVAPVLALGLPATQESILSKSRR